MTAFLFKGKSLLLTTKPNVMKRLFFLLSLFLITSCGNHSNSEEFMSATKGRYLFNANETIEISYVDEIMNIRWRGQDMIPVKLNDSSFYLKTMNEKLVFHSKPEMRIVLAEKREHEGEKFIFTKLGSEEKTAKEHFDNKDYDKALNAYLDIQKKDSLDRNIDELFMNKRGYNYMRDDKYEEAEAIFKINIALYPKSSNTYDSMADLYVEMKDTVKAIEFYKKALAINPERGNSQNMIKRLTKK